MPFKKAKTVLKEKDSDQFISLQKLIVFERRSVKVIIFLKSILNMYLNSSATCMKFCTGIKMRNHSFGIPIANHMFCLSI